MATYKHTAGTVGGTSATLVTLAGKQVHEVIIQNTHASQTLHIQMDGSTATTSDGIYIGPAGGEFRGPPPYDQTIITGIGSGAGTTFQITEIS